VPPTGLTPLKCVALLINLSNLPARRDGPTFVRRVSEGCFSPPASLETQSSQREKILQREGFEDSGSAHKNTGEQHSLSGSACCYLFSFLSKENKSKTKLCVLCVSAVNSVLSKTLSGSPFKPFLRGVVVTPVNLKEKTFAPLRLCVISYLLEALRREATA